MVKIFATFWYKMRGVYLLIFALAVACTQERNIEVDLPLHQERLSVECYMERGQVPRLILTETQPYLDSLRDPRVNQALVVVSYQYPNRLIRDTFQQVDVLDIEREKVFNFQGNFLPLADSVRAMELRIEDEQGRRIRGQTEFLPIVPLDSLRIEADKQDSTYGIIVYVQDPPGQRNYFRLLVNKDSVDTEKKNDVLFDDAFYQGDRIPVFTSSRFRSGDTVYVRLFNLTEDYYSYLESKDMAIFSNGSPFAQPQNLQNTVQGGFGVFTTLNVDARRVVIP